MLAEYWSDGGIGATNAIKTTDNHGKFLGYVTPETVERSNSPRIGRAVSIPVLVNMEEVRRIQAEHDARIERMENGGSYWS